MFPILNIGSLAIQTPGLIYLLGLWIGLNLAEKYSKNHNISADAIYSLVFTSLIVGIFGARLSYIARFPSAFAASPASMISLNPGLLDPAGGIAAAVLAALIYGSRNNIGFWLALDALTPLFAILLLASKIADLASGAGFGAPTNLPWGIDLWGTIRHPVQIYEAVTAAGILLALWPGRPALKNLSPGNYFILFAGLTALARVIFEPFRGDSLTLPGGYRTIQVAAWLALAVCLWLFRRLALGSTNRSQQN